MCFGPVASFTASGVLFSIGAAVLKNVRSKKEILFSAFPILFALQQLIEGVLWLMVGKGNSQALEDGLSYAFLVMAYCLWPVLCPLSVYAIEYNKNRKKILRALIFIGAAASLYLLFFITARPIHAVVVNACIRYETHVSGPRWFPWVYFVVIIFPYFFSSHRSILVFGIPNLFFCVVAFYVYNWAFISVWCFFAALVSLTLYFFLKRLHHQPLLPIIENPLIAEGRGRKAP